MQKYKETKLIEAYKDQYKTIYVKNETEQISGAFKYRGIYNKLMLTSHVFPTQIKNRNPSDRFFVGVPVIL